MKNESQETKNNADQERSQKQAQLAALRAQKSSLDCSANDRSQCSILDIQIAKIS